jgi:CRP-like cAMP-binding protein
MMPDSNTAILDAFSSVASRRYSASTILFMQGEGAHGVFLVREGEVRLLVSNNNGQVVFERIHGPGDLLGLPAVFAGTAYSMTAETITEATLSFMPGRPSLQQ